MIKEILKKILSIFDVIPTVSEKDTAKDIVEVENKETKQVKLNKSESTKPEPKVQNKQNHGKVKTPEKSKTTKGKRPPTKTQNKSHQRQNKK